MEPRQGHGHDASSLLSLGVEEDGEEQLGGKLVATPIDVEEGDKEEDVQSEPEQGAELEGEEGEEEEGAEEDEEEEEEERGEEEEREEEGEEGHIGASAQGPIEDRNLEGGGACGGGEEHQLQQEEGNPEGEGEGSILPADRQQPQDHTRFTQEQLQELESIFQCNQYPNSLARKEIARQMGVYETRVQVWFKNRRARWRRCHRAPRFRNVPFVCPGYPVTIISSGPYNTMFILKPDGTWVCLEPLMLWSPLFPLPPMMPVPPLMYLPPLVHLPLLIYQPPFPYLFLPPLPLFLPPLLPFGLASFNLVSIVIANNSFVVLIY